jgi:hypothetical protein
VKCLPCRSRRPGWDWVLVALAGSVATRWQAIDACCAVGDGSRLPHPRLQSGLYLDRDPVLKKLAIAVVLYVVLEAGALLVHRQHRTTPGTKSPREHKAASGGRLLRWMPDLRSCAATGPRLDIDFPSVAFEETWSRMVIVCDMFAGHLRAVPSDSAVALLNTALSWLGGKGDHAAPADPARGAPDDGDRPARAYNRRVV